MGRDFLAFIPGSSHAVPCICSSKQPSTDILDRQAVAAARLKAFGAYFERDWLALALSYAGPNATSNLISDLRIAMLAARMSTHGLAALRPLHRQVGSGSASAHASF